MENQVSKEVIKRFEHISATDKNKANGRFELIKRFEQICDRCGEKTAITYLLDNDEKELFSYNNIREQAKLIADRLHTSGLYPGDRIAIISVLSPYCYITYFAFIYAELTAVIIDPQLPLQEKSRLLANADVRGITASRVEYDTYANRFDSEMPVFDIENGILYNESIDRVTQKPTPDPDIDTAAILYSSGTTSQAKGVVIGFEQQLKAAIIDLELVGTSNIQWLEVYPFFHISGLSSSLAILLNSAELGLVENVNATKLQQAFQNYRPNTFALVPKVYEVLEGKIRDAIKSKGAFTENVLLFLMRFSGFLRKNFRLNVGKYLFASVNKQVFGGNMVFLGVGGGLSNPKTIEFFLQLGYKWFNIYASTEANVPITTTTYKDNYPVYSSGRVDRFPNIHIKIHNPNDSGEGEILVKSDLLMKGYFREPELTAAAFDERGYFKTGDIGYINKKNELRITGRAKEFICLHNGEKVSPEDIERIYAEVIEAASYACAGVQNKDSNFDTAQLFIENGDMSQAEIEEMSKRILSFSATIGGNYSISRIHFVSKLPLTSVGKVKRFELQKIALTENTGG
jgi:long-chain acyl-CoA synthetase